MIFLNKAINNHIDIFAQLLFKNTEIKLAVDKIYSSLKKKNKILICGNGGSAADAQHLTAEYLVRLKPGYKRPPIPIINLVSDISTITACANDFSFSEIFSRNLEAFGKRGDILIVISTSGNSRNIVNVLKKAKKKKIFSIGFLGCKGGLSKKYCDLPIIIESNSIPRIQECHIFLGHFIFDAVEKKIFKRK
jgi:D-sedoheptulose 7-phosphate isomerase